MPGARGPAALSCVPPSVPAGPRGGPWSPPCDRRWRIPRGWGGGVPRAQVFNIHLCPVLPSAAFSGAQGAPKVHGTEVLSARLSAPGAPLCRRRGPPLQPWPLSPAWHPGAPGEGGPALPLPPCPPVPACQSYLVKLPMPGEGSLSWWGAAGDRFSGDGLGLIPTLCLLPPCVPPAWTSRSWPRQPRRSCRR